MAREFVFKLHPGQIAIHNSEARFKVVAAGRRFGKSHLAAILLGEYALTETHNGYQMTEENGVYYVGPTADQGRRIMWPKLRNLLGYHRLGGLIINENVNDGWIQLVNKRKIYIKGAEEPDRLRGTGYQFVVLDEYADMKSSVWDEIIDPALMDVQGDALFIGTPKGKNHFYKLFMGALRKPPDPKTGSNQHWEDWEAFHFKSIDNTFIKASEIRRIENDPNKTREQVDQELNASFLSGSGKVISRDNFKIIPYKDLPAEPMQTFVTVDLAGFEPADGKKIAKLDNTAITTTYTSVDKWYIRNQIVGQWDPRRTAFHIVTELRRQPDARLGIEKGALKNAIGPYLEDYMRELGRYVTPEALSHGNTKKQDRIEWALAGRSQRGQIYLIEGPWNEAFLEEADDFPDPLAHDDRLDSAAYVDQMARSNYTSEADQEDYWQPLDLDSGY